MHISNKYSEESCQAKEALQSLDIVWGRHVFDRGSPVRIWPSTVFIDYMPQVFYFCLKKITFRFLNIETVFLELSNTHIICFLCSVTDLLVINMSSR